MRTFVFLVAVGLVGASTGYAKPRRKPTPNPAVPKIDVEAARAQLQDADLAVALPAALQLGEARQPGALDALLDALAVGLHPDVAGAALDGAGAHGDQAAVPVLLYYARHRSPGVRAQAVAALGGVWDARARAAVLAALVNLAPEVRTAAAGVVEKRREAAAGEVLIALLQKGDEAAAGALAAIADADLARRVTELMGQAPDALIADFLGQMLLRTDLGKEKVYVDLVRALAKIPGEEAVTALKNFVASLPAKSNRQSKREAEEIIAERVEE